MMNRRSLKLVLTICAIFGFCIALGVGQAQASLIYPPKLGDDSFNDAEADIETSLGFDVTMLEEDVLPDTFDVGFSDSTGFLTWEITNVSDPGTADIVWDLGTSGYELYAVSVKDGNANQSGITWLWYEVTDTERTSGSGAVSTFLNGNGAISNMRLYVAAESIPDASVMLLLGSSFLVLAVFSKKRKTI